MSLPGQTRQMGMISSIHRSVVVLVVGPESSGTRVTTKALAAHPGIEYEVGERHGDPLEMVWQNVIAKDKRAALRSMPAPKGKVILTRRSIPHGAMPGREAEYMVFPPIAPFVEICRESGHEVFFVVTSRSPHANLASWARQRNSAGGKVDKALWQYHESYPYIFGLVTSLGVPFAMTSLEGLVNDGSAYVNGITTMLGLEPADVTVELNKAVNERRYSEVIAA